MTEHFTHADAELVAEAIAREWGYDSLAEVDSVPDTEGVQARNSAEAALRALSAAGRLVPEGSEVREEWGVRWPDGDVTYRTEQQAQDFATAYPGQPDAFVILRRVITTPWTPTEPEEKPDA